jgi:hypothetical protein
MILTINQTHLTIECATGGHGRCKDTACECFCNPHRRADPFDFYELARWSFAAFSQVAEEPRR